MREIKNGNCEIAIGMKYYLYPDNLLK